MDKKVGHSNFRFQMSDFRLNKIRGLVFAIDNIKDGRGPILRQDFDFGGQA